MDVFTYLWLRDDGTPVYVGKGCPKRPVKDNEWRRQCGRGHPTRSNPSNNSKGSLK